MFIIIVNEKGSIELRIDFSKIKGQMTSFISFKARKLASHSIPEVIDFFFLKSIRLRQSIHLISLIGLKTVWENMIYFDFKRFQTVLAFFANIFSDFVS